MMLRSAVRHFARRSADAIVSAACVAGLFAATSAAYGQGLYQTPKPNLNTSTTPSGIVSADFARSGFQSLAVTVSSGTGRTSANDVEVYLSTGTSGFGSGVTYATCAGPTAVLAQDVNSDGYPDLVVACPGAGTVDVLLNNGAAGPGTFGAATAYTVSDPVAMVAGDFTNNGQTDIAVASGNNGGITVLLNNKGSFTTVTSGATGTLSGIAAGDFNHDGKLDVAVSNSGSTTGNVRVLFGNGNGTFTSNATYTAGSRPGAIVATDFNNDGNVDLAVSNAASDTVNVLLGTAAGTFGAAKSYAAGNDPIGLVVTDVNSDGAPDLIALDSQQVGSNSTAAGATSVLLGNGDGTMATAQSSNLSFVPGALATVADFSREGKPDFAITQPANNLISVVLNNTLPTAYPDGRSYTAARALTNGNGNMADSVATGDFNEDGLLDIAVSYLSDNEVRVLTNNGNGFNAATAYAVGQQPYWVASGDLNGDGYPDLVTANTTPNAATGTVSVLINNGKSSPGTFKAAVNYSVGKDPYQVAIGDLNNDGIPYLAVTNYGSNTVTVLKGSTAGTFTTLTTLSTCVNPYGVAIGDFAHNGYPSIAVSCYGSAQMEVFPNNENGTFGTPVVLTTDTNPGTLVVGDFNRDGKLDIVVGNTTANDVYFFAGNGNNTFNAGVESPSLNFPATIAAGDINGDGILDIVGVAPNFNDVVVTLGVGDGTFGTFDQRSAGEFPAAKQPWGLALGDFNNDGKLDIVTANTYNQVNIALPAYQQRYMAEYPAIPAGNPSIDVLSNTSGTNISVASTPASPLPAVNTGVTIHATVLPTISGATPTGSVIFEDATGAPVGTGPYDLTGGVATYSVGHLGSGQYLFTSLYSGDANFQPNTVSGSNAMITVAGTPVTLVLSASSVDLGSTFTATVTVLGNATTGSYPHGTATIYAVSSGGTTYNLGTTMALAQDGFGSNDSSQSINIKAVAPDLNVGTYELYAVYNPSNGTYAQGSSSNEPLAVITVIPTSTSITCTAGVFGGTCTSTTTVTATGAPVPIGSTINFSGAATGTETTNAAGQATIDYSGVFGSYTITATFPAQNGYGTSSNSTTVFCFIICGLDRRSPTVTLSPFSGLGVNEKSSDQPAGLNRNQPGSLSVF